jgi:DNA replication ATP-dependent helicase Dna2
MDEASQITLPTCLGPLRFADKFVLVGDHFQLPPLVKSTAARKGGLDVSLFRRLSDTHSHATVELTQQYRMNEDIMLLSNKLVYQDKLRCGNKEVAKRVLGVPKISILDEMHVKTMRCSGEECWLKRLIDPRCVYSGLLRLLSPEYVVQLQSRLCRYRSPARPRLSRRRSCSERS